MKVTYIVAMDIHALSFVPYDPVAAAEMIPAYGGDARGLCHLDAFPFHSQGAQDHDN